MYDTFSYLHPERLELYDLRTDKLERRNLAGDPASAAVLAELKDALLQWQRKTDDPWLRGTWTHQVSELTCKGAACPYPPVHPADQPPSQDLAAELERAEAKVASLRARLAQKEVG
eukprot:COSAG04_NODE_364_length_15834_cov_4.430315_14_plen_116_part_00